MKLSLIKILENIKIEDDERDESPDEYSDREEEMAKLMRKDPAFADILKRLEKHFPAKEAPMPEPKQGETRRGAAPSKDYGPFSYEPTDLDDFEF